MTTRPALRSSPDRNRLKNSPTRPSSITPRWPVFPAHLCSTWALRLRQSGVAHFSNTAKIDDTPVAIVRRCSLPDQETIYTTLGDVPRVVLEKKLRPPAVVIVGDVAGERRTTNWFTTRPLFGRTVLVTRPIRQADDMAHSLRNLGANVLCQPAIEITEPRDWAPLDAVLGRLAEFDWLVFSSSNGVEYFFRRLYEFGRRCAKFGACAPRRDWTGDGRGAGPAPLAGRPAAGRSLSRRSARRGARAACSRQAQYSWRAPVAVAKCSPKCSRPRARTVEQAVVYESRDVAAPDEEIVRRARVGRIDWTTVTSSAIARSLVAMFGDVLRNTRLVAISPLTADVLSELGHPPSAVAKTYTTGGVVAAILAAQHDKV